MPSEAVSSARVDFHSQSRFSSGCGCALQLPSCPCTAISAPLEEDYKILSMVFLVFLPLLATLGLPALALAFLRLPYSSRLSTQLMPLLDLVTTCWLAFSLSPSHRPMILTRLAMSHRSSHHSHCCCSAPRIRLYHPHQGRHPLPRRLSTIRTHQQSW